MTSDVSDIRIAIDMPDRRGLLARLCAELAHTLAPDERWERGDAVVPWHATAPTFAALPERVIAAVLDEWEDVGDRLSGLEFSGYLETDHGPRAWGCIHIHEGRPRASRPEVESLEVEEIEGGYRLEARLRAVAMDGADA
jgi:hypothetical protein